jgi:hypothetical protein
VRTTKAETKVDESRQARIARAKGLIIEALALLDDACVPLPATYLDHALAKLNDEATNIAAKP